MRADRVELSLAERRNTKNERFGSTQESGPSTPSRWSEAATIRKVARAQGHQKGLPRLDGAGLRPPPQHEARHHGCRRRDLHSVGSLRGYHT